MRRCGTCNKPDELYYDFLQSCTCKANPAHHGLQFHELGCRRVRHRVIPFRIKLRRYRKTDGEASQGGSIKLLAEHSYYTLKGFAGHMNSGFLWAEKALCHDCIVMWERSQAQKRLYEARVKDMSRAAKESYYQMLTRNE